jgi:hypothetical protein
MGNSFQKEFRPISSDPRSLFSEPRLRLLPRRDKSLPKPCARLLQERIRCLPFAFFSERNGHCQGLKLFSPGSHPFSRNDRVFFHHRTFKQCAKETKPLWDRSLAAEPADGCCGWKMVVLHKATWQGLGMLRYQSLA